MNQDSHDPVIVANCDKINSHFLLGPTVGLRKIVSILGLLMRTLISHKGIKIIFLLSWGRI